MINLSECDKNRIAEWFKSNIIPLLVEQNKKVFKKGYNILYKINVEELKVEFYIIKNTLISSYTVDYGPLYYEHPSTYSDWVSAVVTELIRRWKIKKFV